MSDQDNITLIRRLYTAFGGGDLQTILDNVADDAEWINHGPATIPYAGSWQGKARIREFFQAIAQSTTGGQVVPDDFVATGDAVVSTGRYRAAVKSTGTQIDSPVAHFFTIRNGKVVKWVGFSDTAHVSEAHTGKAAAGR